MVDTAGSGEEKMIRRCKSLYEKSLFESGKIQGDI
jgi:hypothetical protein